MEGNCLNLNAFLLELSEEFGGEVEACCWGCGATWLFGEDGLAAVAVFGGVVAVDVGGERHVADFVEDSVEVGCGGEAEGAFAEFGGG